MATTKIQWTQKTWNVASGCSKVSEACQNCYAEVMARRLQKMPASKEKYKNGFKVTLHPECLNEPYTWKKPSMVFVCSMGDLFHKDVPDFFINAVMQVVEGNPQHTFQLLTKRAKRMFHYFYERGREIPKNCWLGVTCESGKHKDRVDYLRLLEAPVRFISCEPLLGDMADIDLEGIDWVITGGECGTMARKTPVEWFRNLRDRCIETSTPFFFKQWGAFGDDGVKRSKYQNGSLLDGREWKEMPKIKNLQKNKEYENWILAKDVKGDFVKVRQTECYSRMFLGEDGTLYDISDLDFTQPDTLLQDFMKILEKRNKRFDEQQVEHQELMNKRLASIPNAIADHKAAIEVLEKVAWRNIQFHS